MQKLFDLSHKETKNVIGLMSGTSVDAVDVALIKLTGKGIGTKIDLIGFLEYPFNTQLREMILKNSEAETSSVEDICKLNFIIPQFYYEAIKELCNRVNFDIKDVDLIGSHGQTIQHLPGKGKFQNFSTASTLQIGDPSVLAKITGVITVGDFRNGDIALGGQGAPLVPYFDYILFHSKNVNRGLLNIGGISNITILNKHFPISDVLAFDTGPGNMMIDLAMKLLFNIDFDYDGNIGKAGKLNDDLFNALVIKDRFIEADPPKSTGREYYGMNFLQSCFDEFQNISKEDWVTTLTHFTAFAIYRNYEKYILPETKIDELIVSGGGAKNKFLLLKLKEFFKDVNVKVFDTIGISADAKEAICFAVLANETIFGNYSNIPRTTGASSPTVLGKICLP